MATRSANPAASSAGESTGLPAPRTSLRGALTSGFIAFALIPIIAGGLIVVIGGSWLIGREVFSHMQSIADGTCARLQDLAAEAIVDLDRFVGRQDLRRNILALSEFPSPGPASSSARRSVGTDLAQLLTRNGRQVGSAVVAAVGTGQVLAWQGCTAREASESARDHAAPRALAAAEPRLSPAHVHGVGSPPMIAVVQVIPRPEGDSRPPVATITWHIALATDFYPAVERRSRIGRTGEIVLVDSTGLVLRDLRYDPGSAFRRTINTIPARAAIQGVRAIRIARDYRGVPAVTAVGRVPLTGWGVVAKEDATEAFAGVVRLALIWASFVLLLLAGTLVTSRRSAARFLEPVDDLAAATRRLAGGDLTTAIPEHRQDELGQLIADFNLMAVEIAAAHHALSESEERHELAFTAADEGLWDWRPGTGLSFLSARCYTMLGYEPGEFAPTAENWQGLIHPADMAANRAVVTAALVSDRAEYDVEYRARTKQGQWRWIHSRAAVVSREPDGTPARVVGALSDITVRKQAEEALAESRALLVAVMDSTADMIASVEPEEFRLLTCNRAFRDEFLGGHGSELHLGMTPQDIMPTPELAEQWCELFRRAVREGPYTTEYTTFGSERVLDASLRRVERDGAITAISVFAHDVTGLRRTEAALRESEHAYRSLFEGMLEACAYCRIIRDDTGLPVDWVYLDVNPAFYTMTGYTNLAGMKASALGRGARETNPYMFDLYGRVAATGQAETFEEYIPSLGIWADVRVFSPHPEHFVAVFDDITARKAAEEALRESEELFRTTFERASIGKCLTDLDGSLLRVNEAFCNMLGRTREELRQLNIRDITHPADLAASRDIMARLSKAEPTGRGRFTKRYLRADGETVWAEVTTALVRGEDGSPRYFITQILDITAQHQAQEALADLTARLQAVIKGVPVAVAQMDFEQGIRLWNPAAEELFGWTEAEVLGRPAPPTLPAGHEGDIEQLARAIRAGEVVRSRETVRMHRDGTLIPLALSAAPLLGPAGQVTGWIAIMSDLRERLQAQRDFEERTALGRLVEVTHRLLLETTAEGLLQRLVEGACELIEAGVAITGHGYDGGSFTIGATARSADTPPCPEGEEFAIARGGVYLRLLTPNGVLRLTDAELRSHPDFRGLPPGHMPLNGLLGVPLSHDQTAPTGIIMLSRKRDGEFTARDEALLRELASFASLALARLNALQALERHARALAASNKELESFSYSVSHDLRAPLRAIDGFSQALEVEHADELDEEGVRLLGRVRGASRRMGQLIDDLLHLSRMTRDPMRYEPVDLSALAAQLIVELRAGQPQRQVEVTIAPGMTVQGHPLLLRALLGNLLGNAWKFTGGKEQARIVFGCRKEQGETVYFVEDNGAGFEMGYADKLFAPFQRLHDQTEFPGSGVGLATALRVINRHGGRIWAEGRVGEGAVFSFTLGG